MVKLRRATFTFRIIRAQQYVERSILARDRLLWRRTSVVRESRDCRFDLNPIAGCK